MSFFIHEITVFHFNDEENVKKIYFDGDNLPKVYFRHNQKINVVNERNTKRIYWNYNNSNY